MADYMTNDESFLDLLIDHKEDVSYRPHPRYNCEGGFGFKMVDSSESFEIQVLLDQTIDNKMLISYFSTACLVPKLLFNKEPYLVFLYGICNSAPESISVFIEKFRDLYSDSSKIAIISNKNEFNEFIDFFYQSTRLNFKNN